MRDGLLILDSDLHVMEPYDLWERYLEDEWRDQAPKLDNNPMYPKGDYAPRMQIQGHVIPAYTNEPDAVRPGATLHRKSYEASRHLELAQQRGFDAETTLQALDIEGVDIGVLYGSRGRQIMMHDDIEPVYAAAVCRAYNNWVYDYTRANPERLKLGAQVSFHNAELAAEEVRRAVTELGAVGVIGNPNPINGRHIHDSFFDPFWAEVNRLGVPVGLHPTNITSLRDDIGLRFLGHPSYQPIAHSLRNPVESMLAFASLALGGVFERYPNVTVAFLESTCGWVPWLLERLDDQWDKYGPGSAVKLSAKPSEYFLRNCYVAMDPEEAGIVHLIDRIGDDRIVLSTDYPHGDGLFPHAIESFLAIEGLSNESRRKILWDNCARFYKLPTPVKV